MVAACIVHIITVLKIEMDFWKSMIAIDAWKSKTEIDFWRSKTDVVFENQVKNLKATIAQYAYSTWQSDCQFFNYSSCKKGPGSKQLHLQGQHFILSFLGGTR